MIYNNLYVQYQILLYFILISGEEHVTPACQILQKHFESLSQLILPSDVVKTLYEKRVISEDTRHQMQRVGGSLSIRQLRELHDNVLKDHNQLAKFACVLLPSVEIGVEILTEYRKYNLVHSSMFHGHVVYNVDQIFPRLNLIHLPPTDQEKFVKMRMDLGSLFDDVAPLIEKGARPLTKFKDFLQRCFPNLKRRLDIAKSFKCVFEIVQEKCSIINIACLERIVERYHIETAEKHITTYKEKVDAFCKEIKLSVCESANLMIGPSSFLKCEKIEFVLEWNTDDEHTLNEIRGLLWKAFRDMADEVFVEEVKKGNSIIVTCNAPQHIMDTLVVKAKENLELLKQKGVIKLTIGYEIIWDAHKICEPSADPVPIQEPLLHPVSIIKHSLDPAAIKEPSLDPVSTQEPIIVCYYINN